MFTRTSRNPKSTLKYLSCAGKIAGGILGIPHALTLIWILQCVASRPKLSHTKAKCLVLKQTRDMSSLFCWVAYRTLWFMLMYHSVRRCVTMCQDALYHVYDGDNDDDRDDDTDHNNDDDDDNDDDIWGHMTCMHVCCPWHWCTKQIWSKTRWDRMANSLQV